MSTNENLKRLKIILTGTTVTALWDGRILVTEDLKENELFQKYAESRWVKRIIKNEGRAPDYDIRVLYALDEASWMAKMNSDPRNKTIRPDSVQAVDFTEFGKKYIKELMRSTGEKSNKMPFDLEYHLEDTEGLNKSEKRAFYKKAKSHENVANIFQRKTLKETTIKGVSRKIEYINQKFKKPKTRKVSFWKRIAAVSAAALSMFGTLFGLKNTVNTNNYKSLNQASFASETIDIKEESDTANLTQEASKSWDIPKDQLVEIENKTDEIINANKNKIEDTMNKTDNELELGTILEGLPEGFEYQEGVDGGNIGRVGTSASPSNGYYVIDHSCKKEDNNYDIKEGTDGSRIDGQWGHISLVKANSIEEAKAIIKENKKDDNRVEPRGWAKISALRSCAEAEKVR